MRFFKHKKKEEGGSPEEWTKTLPKLPETVQVQKVAPITVKSGRSFKIHVPYLLTVKRVIAAFLLVANFFIAQATLTSAPASQPLYILFFLNSLIFLDYLWKTRRKTIEKERWQLY